MDLAMENHSAVYKWSAIFSKLNVPDQDAKNIGIDIRKRLEKTCGVVG